MSIKRWTEGMKHKLIEQAILDSNLYIMTYRWNGQYYAIIASDLQGRLHHIKATTHKDICKWEVTGIYQYQDFDKSEPKFYQYQEEK